MAISPNPFSPGWSAEDQEILDRLHSLPERSGTPTPAWMPRRRAGTDTAADIARREGLPGLIRDVERLRHAAPSPSRRGRTGKRRPGPDRETLFLRTLLAYTPKMPRARVVGWARDWSRVPITVQELPGWLDFLGLEGAAQAHIWCERGLTRTALEIRVDGRRIRNRIRGGESVDSVIARARELGIALEQAG